MKKCFNLEDELSLKKDLLELIKSKKSKDKENIVFIFIGTDRSTGDSYAPLCGTLLTNKHKELNNDKVALIGNLHNPVHAKNLIEKLDEITCRFPNSIIVAIDACLGKESDIGNIVLDEKPICPGSALNKELPPIGDISIKGMVNMSASLEFLILQNTRLARVYDLATVTANAISYAIENLN